MNHPALSLQSPPPTFNHWNTASSASSSLPAASGNVTDRASVNTTEILSWLNHDPQPSIKTIQIQIPSSQKQTNHSASFEPKTYQDRRLHPLPPLPLEVQSRSSAGSSRSRHNDRVSRSYLDLSEGEDTADVATTKRPSNKNSNVVRLFRRRKAPSPTSPLHAKFVTTRREIISFVPARLVEPPRSRSISELPGQAIAPTSILLPSRNALHSASASMPGISSFSLPRCMSKDIISPSEASNQQHHPLPPPPRPSIFVPSHRSQQSSYNSTGSMPDGTSSRSIARKATRILGIPPPPVSPQHSIFAPQPPKPSFISHAPSYVGSSISSIGSGRSGSNSLFSSALGGGDTPSSGVSFVVNETIKPKAMVTTVSTLKKGGPIVPSKAKKLLGIYHPPPPATSSESDEEDSSYDDDELSHAGLPLQPPRLPNFNRDSGLFSLYTTLDAFSLSTTLIDSADHLGSRPDHVAFPLPPLPSYSHQVLPLRSEDPLSPKALTSHQSTRSLPMIPSSTLSNLLPLHSHQLPVETASTTACLHRRPTLATSHLPSSYRESGLLPDDSFSRSPAANTAFGRKPSLNRRVLNAKRLTLITPAKVVVAQPKIVEPLPTVHSRLNRIRRSEAVVIEGFDSKRTSKRPVEAVMPEHLSLKRREREQPLEDVKTLSAWEAQGWWDDDELASPVKENEMDVLEKGKGLDAADAIGSLMITTTLTSSDGHGSDEQPDGSKQARLRRPEQPSEDQRAVRHLSTLSPRFQAPITISFVFSLPILSISHHLLGC